MATQQKKTYWIGGFAFMAVLFLAIFYLSNLSLFPGWEKYRPIVQRLSIALFTLSIVLLVGRLIEKLIDSQAITEGSRYNLIRITRLLVSILAITIIVSFLFRNLYTILAGVGIVSLILGFALQAPITSFIAWLYIVFRRPYQVGDRIQIGTFKGEVIDIGYLDTIIEEFSGIYLGNDRKSGRIIHFPNSIILREEVFNYSGQYLPFIWNETSVQIAYSSDLDYVEECFLKAAIRDFKEQYPDMTLKGNEPQVYFRDNDRSWLEAVISYPVEPTDTTGRRNRILRYALPMLNADLDKVHFPQGPKKPNQNNPS